MRAVIITRFGGPEVLAVRDVPTPQPVADRVLVRVHAAGLNRADLLQRRGHYPAPEGAPQEIPGLEFAGEVAALGAEASLWKIGTRVFGITSGGAHAEYIISHERMLMEIPQPLNWAQAAAVPEAYITAHDALWIQAALRPQERVLIQAVGSGVGLAALQLARAMNAVPFGTSRTQTKLDRASALGMQEGWKVQSAADLAGAVKEQRFDIVLELAGGDYLSSDLELMANKGRLILVGTMAGTRANIALGTVLAKRLRVIGTVLRSRSLEEKIIATQTFAREALPLFSKGALQPEVDRVFKLGEIAKAHEYMEANSNTGKIVLLME